MKKESEFQKYVVHRLNNLYPKNLIVVTDGSYIRSLPDIIMLCPNGWAVFEIKKQKKSHKRPNQEYYINFLNNMGPVTFARFISQENIEEVLDELIKSIPL